MGRGTPAGANADAWDPRVLLEQGLHAFPGALPALAECFGDRVAVEAGDAEITYVELAKRSNDVAIAISDRASDSPRPIALLLGDGVDPVVMLLGAESTGHACVPLDPGEPLDRLAAMVRSCDPQLVLTVRDHTELAAAVAPGVPRLVLEDVAPTERRCPTVVFGPDDPALVMFTSGSTGSPKGVVLPGATGVLGAIEWSGHDDITSDDRIAQLSSLSYVVSVLRIPAALIRGARLCSYDLQARGPRDLAAWIRNRGITVVGTVPSVLRTLHAMVPRGEVMTGVRRVALMGEPGFGSDVRIARDLFGPDVVIANQFGCTEAGGIALHEIAPGDEPDPAQRLPAGLPWGSATVTLVGEDGEPVPDGEPGRVVALSHATALGYWDDPELTGECFFVAADGRRGFRTSDLARRRPDGVLELLGPIDSRVKVRGTMVATSEVETALLALDDIAEAAVVAVDEGDDGQRLIGYVVLRAGARRTGWQVRRDVARLVPPAMVPGVVTIMESMPRGPGGKVDRAELLSPPVSAPSRPGTTAERDVAAVFADVLGIDDVGPDDDFFALGGDSLDAVELIAALVDRFGVEIPASALLDTPTPAHLSRRLGTRRPRTASVLVALQSAGTSVPFVCVAGGGAPALSLRALASSVDGHADGRRPFYALQARGLEERAWPDRTVEAMARRNARAIQSELGSGPFVIGGYSFGGQVGFETAVRLVVAGVDVRALVLIDALPAWELPRATARAWAQVTGARHTSTAPSTKRARRSTVSAARRYINRKAQLVTAGLLPRQGLAQYDLFLELHSASAVRYRPSSRFAGPAVVIRFSGPGRIARGAPDDLGWSAWIDGPITVVELRGKHLEMLRPPDVAQLGAQLRAALDAIESTGGSGPGSSR